MDSATKEALLNLLRNLRHAVEQQYYINEMAWRTYSALVQMFPEFPDNYRQADKRVSFEPGEGGQCWGCGAHHRCSSGRSALQFRTFSRGASRLCQTCAKLSCLNQHGRSGSWA
jgi:hypothetical protein